MVYTGGPTLAIMITIKIIILMIIIIILAGENLEFKLMLWVCLSAYTYKVEGPPK